MALPRIHEHWREVHFDAHLNAIARKPFAWGEHDCCLFAADAIQSFTGIDIAADFRGKYTDKLSAFKAIRAITGGNTVADAAAWCAAKHGLVELQHPLCAQRGDLVVLRQSAADTADQLIAGVVHLSGAHLVSVSESGAVRLPITNVVRAWRV